MNVSPRLERETEVSDLITARWKPHRDTSDLRPTCTTVESNSPIYICISGGFVKIRKPMEIGDDYNRGRFRVFADPLIDGEIRARCWLEKC